MRDIDVTSHLREIASVLCKLKSDEEEEKRRRLLPTACEFTLINVFVFLAKIPFRLSERAMGRGGGEKEKGRRTTVRENAARATAKCECTSSDYSRKSGWNPFRLSGTIGWKSFPKRERSREAVRAIVVIERPVVLVRACAYCVSIRRTSKRYPTCVTSYVDLTEKWADQTDGYFDGEVSFTEPNTFIVRKHLDYRLCQSILGARRHICNCREISQYDA